MTAAPVPVLVIDSLRKGQRPGITKSMGGMLAEAAVVALKSRGHVSGVAMQVRRTLSPANALTYQVQWSPMTGVMTRTYGDPDEAVEFGACGIAILLVRQLLNLAVVSRARTTTGFDYWLGYANETPSPPIARLEVSGLGEGSEATFRRRINNKLKQTAPTDGPLPAYVVIVHYARPEAAVVMK